MAGLFLESAVKSHTEVHLDGRNITEHIPCAKAYHGGDDAICQDTVCCSVPELSC